VHERWEPPRRAGHDPSERDGRSELAPRRPGEPPGRVIVDVADGTSLARAQDAVEQVAAGYGSPDVLDRDAFAADVSSAST
jgi:hypothetical protein